MKLFKFIADSGLLSRRRAQEEIKNAMVTVNELSDIESSQN